MKAVVWRDVGDIALEDVPDPKIEQPRDAVVRITRSAICGTDLHFFRGSVGEMVPGTVLGHEGVGIVEEIGPEVRNLRKGDRVVIPSTIACGYCSYCRSGYYAQCDNANPNGSKAGTAFFGGPKSSGPFNGMQAEAVRVPFANIGPVKLPENVSDDDAIILSDIGPTGYFGAKLAGVKQGSTVAVFGCGPVGQIAITCAHYLGAARVIAVDCVPDRLELARAQGAEAIDFSKEDPVEVIRSLTGGIGVDAAIDAVGTDAERRPRDGKHERAEDQALRWEIEALAKAGTLGIIGVYPETSTQFPIGLVMSKNITIRSGNCNHRRYLWEMVMLVKNGSFSFRRLISKAQPAKSAIQAYRELDARTSGWIKVELLPEREPQLAGTYSS
jgi:threonine dehydrogenase-like Zn-dependent dehydrogenase